MGFVRRVITSALDLANLAKHNANFADIETDLTAHDGRITGAQTDITTHKASTAAHPAEHVTYSGSVAGAGNIQEAVDFIDERLDTIIVGGSEDKDPELTDIKTPDPSYTPGRTIAAAGDVVRDMQKQFSEQLAEIASIDESVQLGPELIDASGWTSAGWTGDFSTGFTHVVGQSTPLIRPVPVAAGKMYQVQLRLTPTCQLDGGSGTSDFTVIIGGSDPFVTYQGAADTKLYSYGILAPASGNLVITPEPRYDGVITELSLKEIVGELKPSLQIKDSTGSNAFEARPTRAELGNVYIGIDSGKYNTTGKENAVFGIHAGRYITSAYWNVIGGYKAGEMLSVGSRNVYFGYVAGQGAIDGDRNIGIGPFALMRNKHGRNNIALGADALWYNERGNDNIGFGLAVLAENIDGSENIGMGRGTIGKAQHSKGNIGIGINVLPLMEIGDFNIVFGHSAMTYLVEGYRNIGIGKDAIYRNANGNDNIGLGANTLREIGDGDGNIAIGYNAGYGKNGANVSGNVIIGRNAGFNIDTGAEYNVLIGELSGNQLTTGNYNILLGVNTQAPTPTSNQTLNIGNTIFGDLSGGHIGIGAVPDPSSSVILPNSLKFQIGRSSKAGGLDLVYSTTTDGTDIGGISFVNRANTNASAATRKDVAGVKAYAVVANSNSAGDSGSGLIIQTKAQGGGIAERMRITDKGKVSIGGNVNPTAALHLPAGSGSANTAPLKFTAGTLNSTPEAGAIEFDGTNLYYVNAAGVRKTITAS